jgi:hypothetical protein
MALGLPRRGSIMRPDRASQPATADALRLLAVPSSVRSSAPAQRDRQASRTTDLQERPRMNRDLTMRWALAIGALIKFFAVAIVRFPESVGRTADLPPPGSKFYSWLLALFIALFGAVYAWLGALRSTDHGPPSQLSERLVSFL